jgi:hypothetical protein
VHDVPGGDGASLVASPNRRNGQASTAAAPLPVGTPDEILAESGYTKKDIERLQKELQAGEKLVWAGRSLPGIHGTVVGPMLPAIFIFVIATANFLIGFFTSKAGSTQLTISMAIGLVALLALVYLVAVPFYFMHLERHAVFALTDRRVLIWDRDQFYRKCFHSLGPEDVVRFNRQGRSEAPNAVGSLVFAKLRVFRFFKLKLDRQLGFLYVRGYVGLERKLREHLIDPYTDRLAS